MLPPFVAIKTSLFPEVCTWIPSCEPQEVPGHRRNLQTVSEETGVIPWQGELYFTTNTGRALTAITVDEEHMYVATLDGAVVLSIQTGKEKSSFTFHESVEIVHAQTFGDRVYFLDAANNRIIVCSKVDRMSNPTVIFLPPIAPLHPCAFAVDARSIYVVAGGECVYVIDKESDALIATHTLGPLWSACSIAIQGDHAFILGTDGATATVAAVSLVTWEHDWSFKLDERDFTHIAASTDSLFITRYYNVNQFSLHGEELRSYKGGDLFTAVTCDQGKVFATTQVGSVHIVE